MANVAVAGQAIRFLSLGIVKHVADQALMAADTVVDSNFSIEGSYAEWFSKVSGNKGEAVIPAVNSFGNVFAEQAFGSVTTVAVGNLFVS